MAVDSLGSWVTPWVRIPLDSLGYQTPGGWLAVECNPWELDSPGYATLGRLNEKFGFLTPRGVIPREIDSTVYHTPARLTLCSMIPRWAWLCAVWYPGEIDFVQYDTPGRFIKIQITQGKRSQNRKYFNPLVSGPGWFEVWKILEVENLVGLSF